MFQFYRLFLLFATFTDIIYLKIYAGHVRMLLLKTGVNFVPTLFIKGRIDSNGLEVNPPIIHNRQWETDFSRRSPTCETSR